MVVIRLIYGIMVRIHAVYVICSNSSFLFNWIVLKLVFILLFFIIVEIIIVGFYFLIVVRSGRTTHTILLGWRLRMFQRVMETWPLIILLIIIGLARIHNWDQRGSFINEHLISIILCLQNILVPLGGSIWIIFLKVLKWTRLQMSRWAAIRRSLTSNLIIWHSR